MFDFAVLKKILPINQHCSKGLNSVLQSKLSLFIDALMYIPLTYCFALYHLKANLYSFFLMFHHTKGKKSGLKLWVIKVVFTLNVREFKCIHYDMHFSREISHLST